MDELSRRNTEAVVFALKEMQESLREQAKLIAGFQDTVSGLSTRVNDLESVVGQLRAWSAGHGPSVRA